MCKVVDEWRPLKNELHVLYLDEKTPLKPYWNYRIDGKIYKPIPMSNTNGTCIALEGEGDFIGKEVEFVK